MLTRVLQLNSFGSVESSLELKTVELSQPAKGQVLVQMEAAPIHPADLNLIEGKYGLLPKLPSVMGNEGMGRILACGEGVTSLQCGDRVIPPGLGMWAEGRLIDAEHCILLPRELDALQAAQISINPPTAYGMLTHILSLPKGSWVAQNAANSAVGRCVIQIARCLGLKTLNVVRRNTLKEELHCLGADAVVTEEEDLEATAKHFCGTKLPSLAFNAVGGASALALATILSPGGTHVTYGAMARQPLKIPNSLLIFKGILFRGFWLSQEWKSWEAYQKEALFKQLSQWMLEGSLYLPVEKTYALENFLEAIHHARQEGRRGKILFQFPAQTIAEALKLL